VDILLESQLEQRLQRQFERIFSGEENETLRFPITLIMSDTTNSAAMRELAAYSFDQLTVASDFGCCTLVFNSTDLEKIPHFCTKAAQNLNCRCYYSHPCSSLGELTQCRQSLNELWLLRSLYFGQYVFSETLLESHTFTGFQPKDTSALISALRSGQIEDVRAAWKDIFSNIKHSRFTDFRFAVRYMIKALNSSYKELANELSPLSEITIEELEDIQQLHLALDSAFVTICHAENSRRMRRLDRLANQINLRISEGYADDILSAQHIADEMGMNHVYLGRLFRESTGISISEAINRVRVEKAKQLLIGTDDSVENIARQVGFNNVKYFFVVFKGIENTTPKKFRTEQLSHQKTV
ncbi:MAG: helix-turn-helix domain-containing protein, partial [Oscillospiraceae bacterium]|nr:helix-turn-helix domain-containing protein [Oscillospiraceae bacterium]